MTSKVKDFYKKNHNQIASIFVNDLYNIEFENGVLATLFDQWSNIDFVLPENGQLFGISARVNFTEHNHNHITIRYSRLNGADTEYIKAVNVYKNKFYSDPIISSFHIQMDSDQDMNIVRAIVVNKRQMIEHIENNIEIFKSKYIRTCPEGNEYFKIPYQYFETQNLDHIIRTFTHAISSL